jgi:hypothetical protein
LFETSKKYKETIATTTKQKGVVFSTHGDPSSIADDGAGCVMDMEPDTKFLDPKKYCDPMLKHNLRWMIQQPQLEYYGKLGAATPPFNILCVPYKVGKAFWETMDNLSLGYLAFMSQFFRRWRGSLRYSFFFTTSSFVSARLQISLLWENQAEQPLSDQAVGDIPLTIITVKGNQEHHVLVPYVYDKPWMPTSLFYTTAEQFLPRLQLKVLSVVGTGDRTPTVPYIVYVTPGDDFVLDSYQVAKHGTPLEFGVAPERATAQCDVYKKLHSVRYDAIPGFKIPESVPMTMNLEDLLYRWSSTTRLDLDTRVAEPPTTQLEVYQNWDYLCSCFLFNSGTVRRRLFFLDGLFGESSWMLQAMTPTGPCEIYSPNNSMAATNIGVWPVLDYSCPWISDLEVSQNPSNCILIDKWNVSCTEVEGTPSDLARAWIKAGNNFQLFHLKPVFKQALWPWSIPYLATSKAKVKLEK